MPKRSSSFDFRKPVAYDAEAKRAFHRHARRRLKQLAEALSLSPGAYDLRSNLAGIAVCGEVTMQPITCTFRRASRQPVTIPGSWSARAKVATTTTAVPITSPRSTF
jgi:hypothetical protein